MSEKFQSATHSCGQTTDGSGTPSKMGADEAASSQEVRLLTREVQQLAKMLQRSNLQDLALLTSHPGRLLLVNLLGGLARGVGIGVGFTVLAAVAVVVLERLEVLNLPVIGTFIADLVRIVNTQLQGSSPLP